VIVNRRIQAVRGFHDRLISSHAGEALMKGEDGPIRITIAKMLHCNWSKHGDPDHHKDPDDHAGLPPFGRTS
jgi:hypothetical protein